MDSSKNGNQELTIHSLFQLMVQHKASDMHLAAEASPALRIDGEIVQVKLPPLNEEDARKLIYQVITKKQRTHFEQEMELDFSFEIKNLARFRANVYFSKGAVSAAFRVIPATIPSFSSLNLPDILIEMTQVPNGLILVTGETGSGKSTTLAAMLDFLNTHLHKHIITLEDPIEFSHVHKKSIISQREVGRDTLSFSNAIKSLLRQDPDIVLVGELRDYETMEAALTIAETGHLTFGTLHTNSCVESLTRLINSFPAERQDMIRTLLSLVLKGVVSQQLIAKSFEPGRVAALEVLIPTSGVQSLIRDNKIHQIYSQMQIGQNQTGMITMNQSLENLVINRVITKEVAMFRSSVPNELRTKLKEIK